MASGRQLNRVEYFRADIACERCKERIGTGLVLQTVAPWLWLECARCFGKREGGLQSVVPQSCEDVE